MKAKKWGGGMSFDEMRGLLNERAGYFNNPAFIPSDPVSVPHRYSTKEDIEISAFITAIISWGQRPVILKNATLFMGLMNHEPYQFILHATPRDLKPFSSFVHRTFNGTDAVYFIKALQHIYKNHQGLEKVFEKALQKSNGSMPDAIAGVREIFFSKTTPGRSAKHFANPLKNASAKRINMFLRWMVRNDKNGVDFGIWPSVSPAQLYCPLDVHSGRVARDLGLLSRRQDDWKAVDELTGNLRLFDPADPVKFDFALFGLGVMGVQKNK